MADKDDMKNKDQEHEDQELPPDIKDWSKHQVKQWILQLDGVEDTVADSLFQQDVNGQVLYVLDKTDLKDLGLTFGPTKLIIHARDELLKSNEQSESSANQPGRPCKPYPFNRYHDTYRYIESNVLDITESGATDFIEPCHEYKAFINTTEETQMSKFTSEVIRFAAACMNSRTNGTIHFGIGDMPNFTHGQVLGVVVKDKEAFTKKLKSAIKDQFEYKHENAAQTCIKPPRFVEVLSKDKTSSEKYVIEVDIVPNSIICEQNYYVTFSDHKKAKKKATDVDTNKSDTQPSEKFFVRDGGSSRNLLVQTTSAKPKSFQEFDKFKKNIPQLSEYRKEAEESRVDKIKCSYQGSRLSQMITGGSGSLDKSHFERYVIVTNKSHEIHLDSIEFLVALNPTAVLDFDPESTEKGLQFFFDKQCTTNVHLPSAFKIIDGVEDTVIKLKLTRNTSWVVCNGGTKGEEPSDTENWLMEKGASVRDVISFLCRKDVLPNKRFLVIFLLLSRVSDKLDPIVETFSTFWQELQGQEQILCICENEDVFTCWKDALECRCGIDISGRCIYELRFSEVNGTILSLVSKNRRSRHFLTCGGGRKVILEKKVESSLNTLDVLCMNQCEGGNEDIRSIEENFYRGETASWWNFYFSEQPGSTPFIKRDKFDFIINTAIPDLCTLTKVCVLLNLMHVPGCGGTTLAMHTLWTLKDKFRCAVLKDSKADSVEVAAQVVKLLLYSPKEQSPQEQLPQVPVMLMIDEFDDMDKVFELQRLIEEEYMTKNIPSKSAQIIVLNCMRSESSGQTERPGDTVFIGNNLSEEEQKQFVQKLKEMEKEYKNTNTFYGFMIMKENFKTEYIEGVVRNTLKNFDISQRHAKLLAILALLNVYCKHASLSVSLCEEFLGLQTKPFCGTVRIEDGFGKFSTLISNIEVAGMVVFKAVKMLHPQIALHCLLELSSTHKVSKAHITNLLLTKNELYDSTQGKDMLMQNIHSMLVKRRYSLVEESQFSPLIQHIASDTPGDEELVLSNASKRFEKDAVISQLLARYYCLKKKNFIEAKKWARKAKELSRDSSYIADTMAQVFKHELKSAIENEKDVPITPEKLKTFLKMGQSAIDGFKETQSLAKKESAKRLKTKTDNSPFNTSGCVGEIQVGLLITEVLEKTPVFSKEQVRHDIMGEVLSGNLKFQDVEQNDQRRNKHTHYYRILRESEDLLYSLRNGMKKNFDFLENFSVNLGSRFGMTDIREQIVQKELFKCFTQYANRFCKTESKELLMNKHAHPMLVVHQARHFLEKQKADTFSGILNCLSKDISNEIMEKIAKRYKVILGHPWTNVTDMINFIYVNVVLSCIKLGSQQLLPYKELLQYLCHVLNRPILQSDSLSLHFIAVLLLWPQQHFHISDCSSLGAYISAMRKSYHAEMMDVYNGKWPVVHFFLGKKQGYERLVHRRYIKGSTKAEHDDFSCIWENGTIWRDMKVVELLERVTGEVNEKLILVDTSIPNLKVEVIPMFKSQLSGCPNKSKVSCFIGFSMKGPVALDIK